MADEDGEIEWPGMRVWDIQETARAKGLLARAAFVRGGQHDHHSYGPTGAPRNPGVGYILERLAPSGFVSVTPKHMRQPECPYPLGKITTVKFTDLLLGEGSKPMVTAPADPVTEHYLQGFFEASKAWDTLGSLRDKAGECGESYISIGLQNGDPITLAHDAWNVWVMAWKQGEQHVISKVVEQKLVVETRLDEDTMKLTEVEVWETRVWDEEHEYVYATVPKGYGTKDKDDKDKIKKHVRGQEDSKNGWIPIAKDGEGNPRIYEHKAGRCPMLLHQNTRNTEHTAGDADGAGGYKLSDVIDRLQSGVVRSTGNNTDPTLAVSDRREFHRKYPWQRKGAGAVVRTSEDGKAYYLEASGEAVATGWRSIAELRDQYLQVVRLVMIDPATAGTYKSGEALKALWRSQNAATGKKRVPLTTTIRSIAGIAINLGLEHEIEAHGTELGEEAEDAKNVMMLAPLVLEDAEREHYGVPKGTGPAVVTQRVGEGRYVAVKWPPFHEPTPAEIQQLAQAMTMATGQKQVVSQQSAVGVVAGELGLQPEAEMARIEAEKEASMAAMEKTMFANKGDGDDDEDDDDDDGGKADDKAKDDKAKE